MDVEATAIAYLSEPRSCTELGAHLWAARGRKVNRQSYARPAGKLIKRLIAKGLVVQDFREQESRRCGTYWGPPLYVAKDE